MAVDRLNSASAQSNSSMAPAPRHAAMVLGCCLASANFARLGKLCWATTCSSSSSQLATAGVLPPSSCLLTVHSSDAGIPLGPDQSAPRVVSSFAATVPSPLFRLILGQCGGATLLPWRTAIHRDFLKRSTVSALPCRLWPLPSAQG